MNREDKRGIFFGVVGVLTLIVAIIGASLAYFSINANSEEDALTIQAATVKIVYEDGDGIYIPGKIIPSTKTVALTTLRRYLNNKTTTDGTPYQKCIDDNGNVVCAVYEFSLTNNGTADVEITARVKAKAIPTNAEGKNTYPAFENLKYSLYDISKAEMLSDEEGVELGYSQEEGQAIAVTNGEDSIDGLVTYTNFNILPSDTLKPGTDNTKRYRLFIWLDEKLDEEGEPIAQDEEQGAQFYGQIFIDVVNEGISGEGTLTGEADASTAE